jgi:hypothetical protein
MAKITSRQDALQTVLRGQLTITIPKKSCRFVNIDFFNSHACSQQVTYNLGSQLEQSGDEEPVGSL